MSRDSHDRHTLSVAALIDALRQQGLDARATTAVLKAVGVRPGQARRALATADARSDAGDAAAFALDAEELSMRSLQQLHVQLKGYMKKGHWVGLIEVLAELAERAETPQRTARMYLKTARVCIDRLEDDLAALHYLEASIAAHPGDLEAFALMTQILHRHRDWGALERGYRRTLSRLIVLGDAKKQDTIFLLWFQLGELARRLLNDRDKALWAYREGLKLHPDNAQLQALIRRLERDPPTGAHEEERGR